MALGLATLVSAQAADIDSLVRALRDPDKTADAKGDTCLQLMDLGPAAAPAVPALIGLLNNQDEMLRDYAVTTLDRIGPAARNALPALRRTATKDSSAEIRELAHAAIAKISGRAPGAEPASPPPVVAADTEPTKSPAPAPSEPASTVPVIQPAQTETPVPQPERQTPHPDTSTAEAEAPKVRVPETVRRPPSTASRPTLEIHQGRFFRWAAPAGWPGSESASGVTLTSPDGLMQVSSALLMSQPGRMTPASFTKWMLGQLPENRNIEVVTTKNLPDQPSGLDGPWKVQELEMRYTVNGVAIRAIWTAGIVNLDSTYDAYLIGYLGVPGAFDRAKVWLASIAHSISPTSPVKGATSDKMINSVGGVNYVMRVQGAGNEKLLLPTNRPLDYPALLKLWQDKGLSEDRILKAQSDGMMGYELVKEPQAGREFEIPMEAWDGAGGGYHNPLRPDEILQPVEQGE
jgi:hypothetical protein